MDQPFGKHMTFKNRYTGLIFCLLLFYGFLPNFSSAQNRDVFYIRPTDSLAYLVKVDSVVEEIKEEKVQRIYLKEPSKAAMLSTVLPGLGQLYNKDYLAVPVIYGLFTLLGFEIYENQNEYIEARNNLAYLSDDDPDNDLLIDQIFRNFDESQFQIRRDRARRDRDYYTILSILVYGANIAHAAVGGHLKTFSVSEDISMVVEPGLQFAHTNQAVPGLHLTLSF
jgi:hypothetical protein